MSAPVAGMIFVSFLVAAGLGCTKSPSSSCAPCQASGDCPLGAETCQRGVCVAPGFDASRCAASSAGVNGATGSTSSGSSGSSGSSTSTGGSAGATGSSGSGSGSTSGSSGLTAPVLTLTSASGQAVEFDVTIGADIFEGYFLRFQVSADGAKRPDGSYTSPSEDVIHQLTPGDVASGAIPHSELAADGFTDPTGTWFIQCRVERDDGLDSAWSNELSGTVTSSVVTWSSVTGVNLSRYISIDATSLKGTFNANVGALRSVRATAPASGKRHFEVAIDAVSASSNRGIGIGVDDGTGDFNASSSYPAPGGGVPGATLFVGAGTNIILRANGVQSSSPQLDAAPAAGDVLICEFDTTTKKVDFYYYTAATASVKPVASVTLTSLVPATWYGNGGALNDGDQFTGNFGGSPFVMPPSAGYNYYG